MIGAGRLLQQITISSFPFLSFEPSPEIIKLAVIYDIRCPPGWRHVEDHETVRFWWSWFGPMFAKQIRQRRPNAPSNWRWHTDEAS